MALVTDYICTVCNEPRNGVVTRDRVCPACATSAESKRRRMHFAALQGLTVEERLERIEKQLYDANAGPRLDALEAKNATY